MQTITVLISCLAWLIFGYCSCLRLSLTGSPWDFTPAPNISRRVQDWAYPRVTFMLSHRNFPWVIIHVHPICSFHHVMGTKIWCAVSWKVVRYRSVQGDILRMVTVARQYPCISINSSLSIAVSPAVPLKVFPPFHKEHPKWLSARPTPRPRTHQPGHKPRLSAASLFYFQTPQHLYTVYLSHNFRAEGRLPLVLSDVCLQQASLARRIKWLPFIFYSPSWGQFCFWKELDAFIVLMWNNEKIGKTPSMKPETTQCIYFQPNCGLHCV